MEAAYQEITSFKAQKAQPYERQSRLEELNYSRSKTYFKTLCV
jgi:hypothetical protein